MTGAIDPIKLKAAAEHLEWVLQQYPDDEGVQRMNISMRSLIDDAKEGRIFAPVTDSHALPFRWAVSAEGLFRDYKHPDIEGAYVAFVTEIEGGLTDQDMQIIADIEAGRNDGRG